MKILTISDVIVPIIYSPRIRQRFNNYDLCIGCGDLPYAYQEYVISMLDIPYFFVRGNHDKEVEYSRAGNRKQPRGARNLHLNVIKYAGLLIAGIEGSLRYRDGPFQYSQSEMWVHASRIIPGIIRNRVLYGRYLDIFISHAPPRGIHDQEDHAHQGIDAFRWILSVFKPAYHFHGHIHVYRPDTVTETIYVETRVINTYGFRETIFSGPEKDGVLGI